MPHSFQRGGWLRTVSIGAALSLSIVTHQSLFAAEGQDAAEGVVQLSGRMPSREIETEDRTQYPGLTIAKSGTSSTSVRKQAVNELLLERLNPDAQQKSQSVLKNLGMFRRLPTISFECDPDVYNYFLRNPDVAVSTWRAMEISQFQLQQTGDNRYRADAGDGSVGDVELFLQTPSETLIHCDGAFKSPLLTKPIVARSLMRLQTSFSKDKDGRIIGTHSGDVFVEFPSHAVEAVAKVISPVSHSIADRNFKQMTLFVHLMSQAMAKHPGWVEQTGNKLEGISKLKRQEFLEVSAQACADSRRRLAVTNGSSFSPEEALSPFRQWNSQGSGLGSTQFPVQQSTRPIQAVGQSGTATTRN